MQASDKQRSTLPTNQLHDHASGTHQLMSCNYVYTHLCQLAICTEVCKQSVCIQCSKQHTQHFVYAHSCKYMQTQTPVISRQSTVWHLCASNRSYECDPLYISTIAQFLFIKSVLLLGMSSLLVVISRLTLYIVSHSFILIFQGFMYMCISTLAKEKMQSRREHRNISMFPCGVGSLLACISYMKFCA